MLLKLIIDLSNTTPEIVDEVIKTYEHDRGSMSEDIKAVFTLADMLRKERAAAEATADLK